MSNFEKITASPETLGAFLASLPIATGPWDTEFHTQFCADCLYRGCDSCPHENERNNPTWWLGLSKRQGEQAGCITLELEPGAIVELENPLRVNIRAARHESPLSEMLDGENAGTRLKAAWQTVEEMRKVHPNAEISVEVEV